ncbi:MAG TPA: hypothetical protein RMH85_09170 [Polyangiaceae bacterium LLY-WYZ-15_(1-7)]|nr:hypothetical protein [Polyangiaceae bacterium LLY-WYZ-15_(1-7)]HJL08656.1 hypothetical protein [Polyangiaceae bacterium LLY-WYZ-15_(1-7)]
MLRFLGVSLLMLLALGCDDQAALGRALALFSGSNGYCARVQELDEDGGVGEREGIFCWGSGAASPAPLTNGAGSATALALGNPACALVPDDDDVPVVRCWGSNDRGQLGDGSSVAHDRALPVADFVGDSGASPVQVATARFTTGGFACAVRSDGAVFCWGAGERGQLGTGAGADRSVPQRVVGATDDVELLADSVALGAAHACALRSDGAAFCWGAGDLGQLGSGTLVDRLRPVALDFRDPETDARIDVPLTLIVAGAAHACGLDADGGVWCWGANDAGQAGDASLVPQVQRPRQVPLEDDEGNALVAEGLFAGARHTCANVAGGGVRCWGANERSQTGLAAPGPQRPSVSPSGLPPIAAGAATFASSCALTDEGGVRCWGAGDAGQLGTGVTEDSALPQRVLGLP